MINSSRLNEAELLNEKLSMKLHSMQEDQLRKLEDYKVKYSEMMSELE